MKLFDKLRKPKLTETDEEFVTENEDGGRTVMRRIALSKDATQEDIERETLRALKESISKGGSHPDSIAISAGVSCFKCACCQHEFTKAKDGPFPNSMLPGKNMDTINTYCHTCLMLALRSCEDVAKKFIERVPFDQLPPEAQEAKRQVEKAAAVLLAELEEVLGPKRGKVVQIPVKDTVN